MGKTAFHRLLGLYRRTLKRLPLLHHMAYCVAEKMALPLLERQCQFYTIPDDPVYFRLELILGRYEPETVAFFKQNIKPGMTVLDIGAHVGYYTRLFSRLVGPSGTVIAFEPHPVHFLYLQKNCEGNENIILINKAIGDQNKTITLYDAFAESVGTSIDLHDAKRAYVRSRTTRELAKRTRKGLPVRIFTAEMVSLDEILAQIGVFRFNAIKMDIEGAEVMALRGAVRLLSVNSGFIVFELDPANLRDLGTSAYDLLEFLQRFEYTKIGIIEDGGKVSDLNPEALTKIIADLEERFSRINCVAWKGQ